MNRLVFLPCLLLTLVSCADSTSQPITDVGHNTTGQPALHAVNNKQLHQLMERMNNLMQERFLTEPELDKERRNYAQKIAKTAQSLEQTLDAILTTSAALKLSKAEEITFQALAQKLRQQSQTLQQQAQQNRLDAIPNSLQQINNTCIACHTLFRKL